MATSGTVRSFQKNDRGKSLSIRGTKPFVSSNQLLVSTGIPSLDNLLSGGLAVGTVLLVEDGTRDSYGKLFLQYFVAEGVVAEHEIFLSSADVPPCDIIRDLPCPVTPDVADDADVETATTATSAADEQLKIAWRYKDRLPVTEHRQSSFGHYYDISKTMPTELLQRVSKTTFDPMETSESSRFLPSDDCYTRLLSSIENTIVKGLHNTESSAKHDNILRIGLHMLGSPFWDGSDSSLPSQAQDISGVSIYQFLYGLRCLLRSSFAVCAITVPLHLYSHSEIVRLEHLSDTVVRIESLCSPEHKKDTMLRDYSGLFNVVKVPHLNGLASVDVNSCDLAFRVRRKRFTIERLHLPPCLADNSGESAPKPSCSSTAENAVLSF